MNKDAQGRWKVGMSNTKLKMRVEGPAALKHPVVGCTDESSPSRNVLRIVNSRNIRLQELTIDGGRGVNVVDSTVRIQGGFTVQNSRGVGLSVSGAGGSDVLLGHQAVSDINSLSNNCANGAQVITGSRLNIQGDTLIEGNGGSGVNVFAGARATFNAFPINNVAQQIAIQNNGFFGVNVFNSTLVVFLGPVHILGNAAGIPSDNFFFPYRAGVLLRFGSLALFISNEFAEPIVIDGNTGPGILAHVSTKLFLQKVTMSNNTGDGLRLQHLSVAESAGQNTTTGNGGAGASCDQNSELFGDVVGIAPINCAKVETDKTTVKEEKPPK